MEIGSKSQFPSKKINLAQFAQFFKKERIKIQSLNRWEGIFNNKISENRRKIGVRKGLLCLLKIHLFSQQKNVDL